MMLNNHPGTFTLVQIHWNDSYATSWGNARGTFYGVSGTPDAWFDGVLECSGASSVTAAYNCYNSRYNTRRAVATDVTIELSGGAIGPQSYRITANVCVEASGAAKTMRVHIVQVLDHWPSSPTYHRYGFKQAASYEDVTVNPGQCAQVVRDFTFDAESWANQGNIKIVAWAQTTAASAPANVYQAAEMSWPFMNDCNGNGIEDPCDLDCGAPDCNVPGCGQSTDCDANGTPDECQPDCNNNGVADACDLTGGTSVDCQPNGVPDECELSGNDCNANTIPDECDIAGPTSVDCQPNTTPDECELTGNDCNGNSVPDECDLVGGTSHDCQLNGTADDCELAGNDCNTNHTPDDCDVAQGTSPDCQPNTIPDECELVGNDCDANSTPDECEPDCNTNGVADACDIRDGTSIDCNTNGLPDECDVARCYDPWDGFQPNPPFSFQRPMSQIDYDGDGVYWQNPFATAVISSPGCQVGDPFDNAVKVTGPMSPPENGWVSSEYFLTEGGALPPEEQFYTLRFDIRMEQSLNPKIDWQFFIYDAAREKKVVEIDFTATVSTRVPADQRGKILVKNPTGSPAYFNTDVTLTLNTCFTLEVVLDNLTPNANERVQVYVSGGLKVTTGRLTPDARRMDYFRLQPLSNGSSGSATTVFKLDDFHLCLTGHEVTHESWDCNYNDLLDECDLASGWSHDCNANAKPDECEAFAGLGDFDHDGDVGLTDYQVFQGCLVGPGGGLGTGCADGDFDCDGDVDVDDFRDFQRAFTGDL